MKKIKIELTLTPDEARELYLALTDRACKYSRAKIDEMAEKLWSLADDVFKDFFE